MITVLCRVLDWDSSWWGLRRFKPAPDQVYSSRVLLLVCLVYGVPMAGLAYGLTWFAADLATHRNTLIDDRAWLPRGVAWLVFVANTVMNGVSCWAWNRRAAQFQHQARMPAAKPVA